MNHVIVLIKFFGSNGNNFSYCCTGCNDGRAVNKHVTMFGEIMFLLFLLYKVSLLFMGIKCHSIAICVYIIFLFNYCCYMFVEVSRETFSSVVFV